MQWYLAKLVFRIVCGEGDHTPQFDEQLRLISATDAEQAFEKASKLGRHEQDSFMNQRKQLVQWQYINISELYKLPSLSDGVELYSRVQEADNAKNYTNIVNEKSAYIRSAFQKQETEAV